MESLSKGEFLSFLYSEKSREIENNSVPGWNIWAIGGIIVSLVIFGYNILVNNDIDNDILGLYFLVALAWILSNLHLLFTFRRRVFSSRKFRKLIEEAPLTLCIIRTALSFVGFCISIFLSLKWYYCLLWGIFIVINYLVVDYIWINRDKIVIAGLKTNIFTTDKQNLWYNLILINVYGLMVYLQYIAVKDYGFYKNEFELAAAISFVIITICKLINITQRNKIAEGLDDIIELFTGGFIEQKEAYKRYMFLIYGKDILQILENEINDLPNIEECISIREQLCVLLNRIEKNTLSVDEINETIETLNKYCDFQSKTLKKMEVLHKRCDEILSLKMPRKIISEFNELFSYINRLMSLSREILIRSKEVYSALNNYMYTHLYCKKTGSICERKACIYRNESMAWTYRFKLWLYKLLHKNNKDR